MLVFENLSSENVREVAAIDKLSFSGESWSESLYRGEIGDPDKFYYVAKENDAVVGFGGLTRIFNEGHIMNIAVAPLQRGRGIGTEILEKMISDGVKNGITAFTLEVRDSNERARKLYEKKGFVLAGVRKRYYAGGEDACIYWLYL